MITIDVSKIPHLEERRKALENQATVAGIIEERDGDPKIKEIHERRRTESARLYRELEAALRPFDDEIAALEKPYDDRVAAIEGQTKLSFRREWGGDCELTLCVLSGLPIIEDEDVVEDCDHTGGYIIRALLPFPADATEATEDPVNMVPA